MGLWPPLKETSNIKIVTLVAKVIIKMGGLVSRHYSLWGQIRVAGPGPSWHETGNSRPVIVFVLLVIIIVIHSSSSCHHRRCHHRSGIVCIILVIMCLCNIVCIYHSTLLCFISLFLGCWNIGDSLVGQLTILIIAFVMIIEIKLWFHSIFIFANHLQSNHNCRDYDLQHRLLPYSDT